MNQNKGIIGFGLLVAIVLGIAVIGGGAYYLGKGSNKLEVKIPENVLPNVENQKLPVAENTKNPQVVSDCNSSSKPSITVLSPNGGEMFKSGDRITVRWSSCNILKSTPIKILLQGNFSGETLNTSTLSNFNLGLTAYPKDKLLNSGIATPLTIPVSGHTQWSGYSPNMEYGTYYRIFISTDLPDSTNISDISDNLFTINSLVKDISKADDNLIKQTGCGVSFSKTSDWSVISNTSNETKLDILPNEHTGFSGIDIKCVLGNSITDTDAKFGNITYYYESSSQKWMVNAPNERDGGTLPAVVATPEFTVNGFQVFKGTGRWLTYIIPISPSSILSLKEGDTEGGYTQTLTNLVKTIKKL